MRGKLITFEGCEGAGKSTQLRLLKNYLAESGQDAIFLREPGGTDISEQIRSVILSVDNSAMTDICEVMLYAAARAQLVGEVIRPALENGALVVCDRFTDSTLAYQGYARGLGVDRVDALNGFACGDCMPDVTVFLDLPPDKSFSRKGGADIDDRLEREGIAFHRKVYEGYLVAAEMYPDRFLRIKPDGSKYDTAGKVISALREKGMIR